jgi:cytosine/adenosine deaminase-related metal-dependent hydrolase
MSAVQSPSPFALRARWVFPVAGPPLRDAAVTISRGRIIGLGRPPRDVPVEDLGQAAIVPGLVNAHTHLEFSDLASPIGRPGMGLVEWLGAVIEHRASAATLDGGRRVRSSAAKTHQDVPENDGSSPTIAARRCPSTPPCPIEQGLRESVGHGVTTIGEIAQAGGTKDAYLASPCGGTIFLELIAPLVERIDAALAAARKHVLEGGAWRPGLSPHAPYTVHPQLLARAVDLSVEREAPLAMHLAESPAEIEWLRDGRGPFRELLESRGAWDATARGRGARPLDELRMLARAHRALVIHGNYLDEEEIELLGRQRRRMAVVYCPRTHAWFGHARYPLEKLLAAGAIVALGTDSRASAPDLSLLAEMREVARAFPAMSRSTVLELGTLGGARALGLDARIGTLEPGKRADLAVVALPEDAAADPHDLLLATDGPVAATWVRGNRV